MTVALIYFYALPINFQRFFCKCIQLEILTERPKLRYIRYGTMYSEPHDFTRYAMFNRIKYKIFRMVPTIRYDGNDMNT